MNDYWMYENSWNYSDLERYRLTTTKLYFNLIIVISVSNLM